MHRLVTRGSPLLFAVALLIIAVLAIGIRPGIADDEEELGSKGLSPYLVGFWDEFGRPDDPTSPFTGYKGFHLRIVNPTPDPLLAVVAVFDSEEDPFACARVELTQNDEAFLRGERDIWVPYGSPTAPPAKLRGIAGYPSAREGVIKLVSLKPTGPSLPGRVREGLVAWITNVSRLDVRADVHGAPGAVIVFSVPFVIELHGVPKAFLRKNGNQELEKIAGNFACGNVGVTASGPIIEP